MAKFVRSHLNYNQSEAINLDYVKRVTNGLDGDNFFILFEYADGSERRWGYPRTSQGGAQYETDLGIVDDKLELK
ncbi:hypothetical protein [Chitinophaga sancti]|uniref:Uncharacterized protein n=1 Tax=Chitinophaga sancti TaxID=1004 RepID=A0A1K1LZP5_9BACT|nr:hypothetical protein [Chitinophaga sancti]WQD64731.1 hypothetical protein U0033_10020 [Chitinophaga sancti]WQG89647.1 hypothetical protein SR876_32455 [Chitinophaga sancti]SFW16355.1 hypothetical protein SAMN05661012_00339 [Chitinophaga sancti]